jgi:type IV pilus assembly protein PilA
MRKKRNEKGFSLVEAIVVAVIMGILSAVAIPMYIGYINDQRQTTVNNLAETAAAAANAFLRRTGTCPTLANLNLYYDTTKYTVSAPTCSGSPLTGSVTVTDKNKTTFTKTANF